MNAPELNDMTDCPELEDLAAFHEGRLTEEERARVLEHVASCGNCQDILVGLDAYAVEERGKVVRGRFGWKAFLPAIAAAAVAVFVFLGMRPSDMEKLVAASAKVDKRPIAARFSADFLHREYSPKRGGGEEDPRIDLQAAALEVAANAESSSSAKDRHAGGVALLLLEPEYHDDAVKVLQEAASKRPNDPAILTDLAAAYYARGDYKGALTAADRALAIEQTPAALWNRALALQELAPKQTAIAAWNKYLAVDSTSEWAQEVQKKYLPNLQ